MTNDTTTTITVPWKLRCDDVPKWNASNCCASCHYDAEHLGIESCTVYVSGDPIPVCCSCRGLTRDA